MSNAKSETIADIVREMRSLGRLDEKSTDKIPRSLQALGLRTYADRIEAAWKRERERGAEAAQICGEIGEMIWREATCRKSLQVGNAVKLREALEKVRFYLPYFLQYVSLHREDAAGGYYERIQEVVTAALSAPPRNCDVGTAEEQSARFDAHCRTHMGCFTCPLRENDGGIPKHCEFAWAQMPYEEGGSK